MSQENVAQRPLELILARNLLSGFPFGEEPLTIALRESRPVHAPLYIRSADGELHHIEVSAFPLASNEETTGAIGIFWRTTEPSSSASADQ
jgi:hypothetical protein